jgi:hypothetical protein
MMRTEIRFGMPAQGLGFVGGALNHLHDEARAGLFQRRRPVAAERSAGVPLQQNEVRHRLDGHQADPRMERFILAPSLAEAPCPRQVSCAPQPP